MIPLNLLTPNADQAAPLKRRPAAPLSPQAEPVQARQARSAAAVHPLRAPDTPRTRAGVNSDAVEDTNKRFEQMLWAEMLRHSGIEEAFTKGGGQAASAFTQFAVEAIAKDLAEKHPLGFNAVDRAIEAYGAGSAIGEQK